MNQLAGILNVLQNLMNKRNYLLLFMKCNRSLTEMCLSFKYFLRGRKIFYFCQ